VTSKVEYDEYVVFKNLQDHIVHETASHEESHITHRFSHDEKSGATMLDLAFRQNFALTRDVRAQVRSGCCAILNYSQGSFEASDEEDPVYGLEGRVRRV
jgi:hypothetical protein